MSGAKPDANDKLWLFFVEFRVRQPNSVHEIDHAMVKNSDCVRNIEIEIEKFILTWDNIGHGHSSYRPTF